MSNAGWLVYTISLMLVVAGFLVPLWPLCMAGVLLAALTGRPFFAVALSLSLDLLWGVPTGILEYLYFPFTLLVLLGVAGRMFSGRYFLHKRSPDSV